MRAATICMIAALARVALAHSITDEVSGGGTQASSSMPASYYVSNRLAGAFNIKNLTLRPGFIYTHAFSAAAPAGASFSTSDANIYFVSLALDAEIGKHWELGFEVNGSPPSSSASDTSITYSVMGPKQTVQQQADGQLASTVASAGGSAFVSYDTTRDDYRKVEGIFELGLAPTEFFLSNQIDSVWNAKMMMAVPTSTVLADCTGKRCASLDAALQGQNDKLFQARIWASATATIHGHTDVGLDGAYYAYDKDPTTVGYSSLTGTGRTASSESSFGNGLPIAPLHYTLRASVATRFANMMISASFLFGQYMSDNDYSYDLSIGLRLQYKLSEHVKLWLKGTAQYDVDSSAVATWGGVGAIGLRATF